MTNPWDTVLKANMDIYRSWTQLFVHNLTAYERLVAHQAKLIHPFYHRFHNMIPRGADWLDHYGRRTHDVNVEDI
jgi:hypothetical protein